MGSKKTISNQIHTALTKQIAFGEPKREAKATLKWGEGIKDKIYSHETYNTYLKACKAYGEWLKEQGVNNYAKLADTRDYAAEYIKYRLDTGVSVYTAKMERSALGKLYGEQIAIDMPTRDNKAIKRSRNEAQADKHYSRTGKYKDLFTVGLATGCRRKDLRNLTKDCLVEKDGQLFLEIKKSKGGRDRRVPVLPKFRNEIKEIFNNAPDKGKIIGAIPKNIDIHSLRREYAKDLYTLVTNDKEYRAELLKQYPERKEKVKSGLYRDSDGNVWERDSLFVVTQALGHNRLEVSVTHYIK